MHTSPPQKSTKLIRAFTAIALLSILSTATLPGADDYFSGGTLSAYFENDLFSGTDRYYTSGIKLSWSSADLQKLSDSPYAGPLLPVFNRIPWINKPDYQKNLVFSLGQNIYTPDKTEIFELIEDDRPYAGWLYLGVGVIWKNAEVRNSIVLDIGVVGPWSYAEETQRLVHDVRDLADPKGWDNQLHNEVGFTLAYERSWRWPANVRRSGFGWEVIPHAGVALGTVRTFVNAGGELRVGLNLPDDFGTAAIGPAATTSTPVDGWQQANRSRFDLGLYFFSRIEGRAVGRDIFLDGNTFENSHSVDRNIFVADISVGVAMNFKNTKIAYALVYRTKEFREQVEEQMFGTVSLNWTF